jgi:predicted DNA-binding transcriptional regulator YafY
MLEPDDFPDGRDDQIRRTARVLDIIQQIAVRPRYWTRKKLAEHHELGERMIQKDLGLIRVRLGLSLFNDGDGYYFERLPHLPTTTYSFAEALALLIAARAAQAIPGVNSAELAAAIARLESLFPDTFRPMLREATEKLPSQASGSQRQTMLTILHRAWIERRQVRISYATGSRDGQIGQRVVEPYHIMPYGRSWQVIAYDHKRGEVLQFKVDRVRGAVLLDAPYTIPADFDVDAYLGDAWGVMRGAAGEPETVVLIFEPEAGRWVAEEQWHHSQQIETLPDGRVRVTFRVGITPEMVSWLLHYGSRVRVVEPEWLGKRVREEHQKAST